ncbi:MAG: 50S ribosomal protein L13 [Acidimicrobiales bacterium]|nr:50S ribosomal protein L13 [Acidimicrobiales bacterium]
MRTYSPKASEITRSWHVIDAEGMVLGRLASEVAILLMGKHKASYAPHMDMGDHVIIVNASKVVMTARKADSVFAYRYSGYPGGLKSESYASLLKNKPEDLVKRTVKGMLPKNSLGKTMIKKLHVHEGATHNHQAQKPQEHLISTSRRVS